MESFVLAKKTANQDCSIASRLFTPTDFAVFDHIEEGVFLHQSHNGAIVTLNHTACELYGYPPGDIHRFHITPLHPGEPPFTAEESLRRFREAAAGHPQLFEWKTKNRLGRDFWIEVRYKAVAIGAHKFVLSIIKDITKRKMTEQRLLLKHSGLTQLNESALNIFDKSTLEELLPEVVAKAGALLGATAGFLYLAEPIGCYLLRKVVMALKDTSLPETLPADSEPFGNVFLHGDPLVLNNSCPIAQVDDNFALPGPLVCVPLKAGKRSIGVLGLVHKQAEGLFSEDDISILTRFAELAGLALNNALQMSHLRTELSEIRETRDLNQVEESHFRVFFNSIMDGIIIAELTPDIRIGRIVEANSVVCRKLGFSHEELLGLTLADTLHPDYRRNLQEKLDLLRVRRYHLFESAFLTNAGTTLPAEITAHLAELDGRVYCIVIARDISERNRLDKELARLDRLNLIGSMAAGLGHEIRNPLTTVRGFLQILAGKPNNREYRDYYELMIQEMDRANSIITEFLLLSRNKAVDLQPGNLNPIIEKVLPLLEAGAFLYNKTVQIDLGDLPDFLLDEKEIRQLIINLVRNGLDAMPPGGALSIRTAFSHGDVVLSVQDQGKGIAPDITDKIGTPFFSTKEYGVGLGLAVCYSVAARHNATIHFESTPTGTTFHVRFHLGR